MTVKTLNFRESANKIDKLIPNLLFEVNPTNVRPAASVLCHNVQSPRVHNWVVALLEDHALVQLAVHELQMAFDLILSKLELNSKFETYFDHLVVWKISF